MLVLLVAGLVAGLVGLAARWARSPVEPTASVCRVEVADPDGEGVLRAELTPDRAANAALVVGLADRRGLPARAATIGIATAIQESGLRNIDYGDRDSLGLFQQRPSQGWGTEEQVQDPVYATSAFYDALVRIDGYTELEVTDAAQRVQRSGFPEAYADHEGEGRALASSLYGLSPASLVCELPPVDRSGDGGSAGESEGGGAVAPEAAAASLVVELQTWATGGWQASAVQPVTAPGESGDGTAGTAGTDGGAGRDGQPPPAVVVLDARASGEPSRTAWALAHTAVALAGRHGVVRVEVDGRVWDRGQPAAGWSDGSGTAAAAGAGAATTTTPGDGLVRITTG